MFTKKVDLGRAWSLVLVLVVAAHTRIGPVQRQFSISAERVWSRDSNSVVLRRSVPVQPAPCSASTLPAWYECRTSVVPVK